MLAPSEPRPEYRIAPDDWPDYIANCEGPQLIVGGPGTGKTEFLVRRAAAIIDAGRAGPENLLVLSFSRRGVADVADRLRNALDRSTRALDISTYHSFALRLLETHATVAGWQATPQVLTSPEQLRFVAALLADEDPALWSPAHRSLLRSSTFAAEVTDFVLRCREQLLGPQELAALGRAEWRGLPDFLQRYDETLRRAGRIDYGTLLATAVDLLAHSGVRAAVAGQYGYVLVDEYQDTSRAQALLLRNLVADHGNITAAADPYQSIYSFRGTDLENVARFPDEFRDEVGAPARRIVLTTSHRVPEAILNAAVRVTQHDLPGAAGQVVPAAGPGSVETYRFEQHTEEAEWVAAEITRLHLEQGLPYDRIAVFVRSKRRFLPELSRALDRRHIPHDRPDARLVDQPAVRFVIDCVIAATGSEGPAERDRAIRRMLLGPLFRMPPGQLRNLERAHPVVERNWPAVIRVSLADGGPLADLLADNTWAVHPPASDGLWHLWSRLPQLHRVATDETRGDERLAWTSLFQVVARFNERNPRASLAEYCTLLDDDSFEARPLLSYRRRDCDSVTVTTLHQSKGLDFDVVFISDAVEGVFPDLRSRDSLLGARHLNPHLPTDVAGYVLFRLQEERRLAYTAMTRAARRVIWTATTVSGDQGIGAPSRFFALVAGTASVAAAVARPEGVRPPVTVAEMEAFLRRLLLDPSALPPDRVAALAVLAQGERIGLRPPEVFYGIRSRGPDTGVVGPEFSLSATQAEAYERCPRRYVLERRLGIGAESSIYAEFGLLMHTVLESVERVAMESGEPRATAGEALEEFNRRFSAERFGGPPFAESWRRRGRDALRRLYGDWPSSGTAIALEQDLQGRAGGIEWRGRADRIEVGAGTVTVVDYKTSRSLPTEADAARSLQLGFYLLAAAADPEITAHGEPRSGEMWFPVATRRSTAVRAFDGSNLPDIESRMEAVALGIGREAWPAIPNGACDRCPVRQICPAQPDGKEAFVS